MNTITAKPRLDYLDSIRALAALGVAYMHSSLSLVAFARPAETGIVHALTHFVDTGKIGVIAFFLVSGFVIPMSLRTGVPGAQALRDFALGRFFRLYPAYWLSVALAFFTYFHGSFAQCSLRRLILNSTMFQGFFGGISINMVGVYWTLQIEWLFYILCMLLLALGWISRPGRILAVCFACMLCALTLAVLRFASHRAWPVAAPLGLSVMLVGTLWRMHTVDGSPAARRYARLAIVIFVTAIPLISVLAYSFNAGYDETWYRYTLCYWFAVAAFLLLTGRLRITWKPLTMVGRASFSLYLFFEFVQMLMLRTLPYRGIAARSLHLWLLMEAVVACAFSWILYTCLESPCIALGRRVVRHFRTSSVRLAGDETVQLSPGPVSEHGLSAVVASSEAV